LKNFKNRSPKLQRFELFSYKANFVLLADHSAGSSKANPPPSSTLANSNPAQKHLPSY